MSKGLCETCSNYQLSKVFSSRSNDVIFRWDVYQLRKHCEFCRLLGWLLAKTDLGAIVCSTITGQARQLEGGQKGLFFIFASSNNKITPIKCPYIVLPLATGYTAISGGYTHLARAAKKQSFDAELARAWLKQCDEKHGTVCRGAALQSPSHTLRLVDTHAQCVVPASPASRYAALSYVWGAVKPPVLRRENEYRLSMKGCLKEMQIPQTIVDAMAVCRELGIRYLWVDSLCIVQDDEDDIHSQMEHMDIIYRRAYLTLIVTTGDNCRAPIPSISQPRDSIQETTIMDGLVVGTTLLRVRDEILKSKWATRGWTLAEAALSHRSLIFTPRGTIFSCSEGILREDMTGYWSNHLPRPQRYMLPIVLDCAIANRVDVDILRNVYAPLVSNLTSRDFTHLEDCLNSFQGIMKSLATSLLLFEWGMPAHAAEHMQFALCWSRTGFIERVEGFPSWSWAGWTRTGNHNTVPTRGVQFLNTIQADAIQRIGDVYRPFKTEISTTIHTGEETPRVDFVGRLCEMIHLRSFIAPVNATTHQAFTEWLNARRMIGENNATIYQYLSSSQVESAETWFNNATLCILLADATDFLIALPVQRDEEDEVYYRVGNPIFLQPRVWEAYKPRAQELFLA